MHPHGAFPSRSQRDLELTRLLRRDEALQTRRIHQLGYSSREIAGLVSHGDLRRQHRGVYVDGRSPLSPRGHLRAALLAAGPTAFLSHRTGAAARGYRAINTRRIELTVISDHTPQIPGLELHRMNTMPEEVSTVSGLRVATLPLLLLQFAAAGDRDLGDLISTAARQQTLDPVAMECFCAGRAHAPGIQALKQALAYYRPTRSGNSALERDVHAWLAEHPEIPEPDEINVRIGPYEWDCLWHEARVALEIDGRRWHSAMADKEKDPVKDAFMQRRGYRIVRLTDWRFAHDRTGFYDDLTALLSSQQAA